jgi:hypothetical protein
MMDLKLQAGQYIYRLLHDCLGYGQLKLMYRMSNAPPQQPAAASV